MCKYTSYRRSFFSRNFFKIRFKEVSYGSDTKTHSSVVILKVTNMENIASTQAVNIVRLPAAELTPEEQEALPSQSFGDETPTEEVGWYTIAVLGLIVAIVVFVMLVRIREDDELLTLPELGPAPQILNDGSPDPQGLPTVLEDEGQLWRKLPDGSLDWWDTTYNIWQRW